MVRRNLRSDFVGGAYVFPGGAVDPLDGGAEAEALCAGRSDAEASTLLGFESGGLAYWVAVVRETFEEAGLLLARRQGARRCWRATPRKRRASPPTRRRSTTGTRRFLDLCRDERLRLSVGDIHYFAHWITPRGAPRRYDTRFFVAAAPPGQIAAHDAGETIADVWITPARRPGPPPGRRDRDHLPDHPQSPGDRPLRHQCRAPRRGGGSASSAVPAIEPRVVPDGNGMRIVLPGRPRLRPRLACPTRLAARRRRDFNDAVREVSMRANVGGPRRRARPRPGGTCAAAAPLIPAVPDFGIGPAPEPGRLDRGGAGRACASPPPTRA